MRSILVLLALLVSTSGIAQNLEAYFSLNRFHLPPDNPYVDVFISFNGRTLEYLDGKASVESTILIKKGNKIIDFTKTKVDGPEIGPDSIPDDFVDVQRFQLKNGQYSVQVYLRDLNQQNPDTMKFSQPFELKFSGNQVNISDIEFVDRFEKEGDANLFTKAGYQVIPYVSNYYHQGRKEISFYAEVYNTDNKFGEGEAYLTVASILNSGGEQVGNYRIAAKETSKNVNVVLQKFNIEELYSGNYQLNVEVRNKLNELIASKQVFFFRNNPPPMGDYAMADSLIESEVLFTHMIPDRDVLIEYIRSMWPKGDLLERNIIDTELSSATTEVLQNFMYSFWYKRDPNNPQEAWDKYNDNVKIVNNLYSTQIRKGYETDRGRVFLQYGKPNRLVQVPAEPSSYPYEIWHYYHLDSYSNIRFVFYNRDLSTNDYSLLHSEMRGEVYYRRWEAELHSRTTPMNNIDDNYSTPHEGGRALDYYTNPR